MHEPILYKINEDITIKQDYSDIESEGNEIIDIFDIGGS